MRQAGPCCLLLALACALSRAGPPRSAVRCQPGGGCFSAHLANSSYYEARSACNRRQAGLAWVSSKAELLLLQALLNEELAAGPGPPSTPFWVGLRRNASTCTDAGQPLRGFSWEGNGDGAAPREVPRALGRWVKEPVSSCLSARCAGLRTAGESGAAWGWEERPCHRHSQGYVCRYRDEGACPDISPAGALSLEYRLPFEESSAGPRFSPPGTELNVECPSGALRLLCRPHSGGFAWEAAEGPLCPCPGRCPGSAGCRDATGAFACAGDLADGTLWSTPGTDPTVAGGRGWRPSTATPVRAAQPPAATVVVGGGKTDAPPPSSSSSSSNYVFILVTVAVVVLILLVMTVLGVFKLCFNKNSEGRGDKEPPDAGSKAGSAETSGAAGSE